MEVHHHPHVEKKRFKDYLLEGLMIFVAVVLGFLAEGLREKITNREKEKEYIVSLVNNLEQDKSQLENIVSENQKKINGLDSLLSLSNKNTEDTGTRRLLYIYSGKHISFYSSFVSNDATMRQLLNSGGLQYIKHHHVADSIAKYDQTIQGIYAAEKPYAKAIDDAMDAMSELLIFKVWNDSTYFKNKQFTHKELPVLTGDHQKTETFFNKVYLERGWTQNYVNNLYARLPYTTRLIAFLRREYGIEQPEAKE